MSFISPLEGSSIDVVLDLNLRTCTKDAPTNHQCHVVLDASTSPSSLRKKLFSSVGAKLKSEHQLPGTWPEQVTFTAGTSKAQVSPTHALKVAQNALRKQGAVTDALHGAVSKEDGSDVATVKLQGELDMSSGKGSNRKRRSGESDAKTEVKKLKVKVEGKASKGSGSEEPAGKKGTSRGDPATTQVQKAYSRIGLLRKETTDALAQVPSKSEASASDTFKRKRKVRKAHSACGQAEAPRHNIQAYFPSTTSLMPSCGCTVAIAEKFKSQPLFMICSCR